MHLKKVRTPFSMETTTTKCSPTPGFKHTFWPHKKIPLCKSPLFASFFSLSLTPSHSHWSGGGGGGVSGGGRLRLLLFPRERTFLCDDFKEGL